NANKKTVLLSFFVAAIGSAMADVVGGFAIFAPLTFFAKGLESMFVNLSFNRSPIIKYTFLFFSAVAMVSVYFVFETLMPNIGLQLAVQEIIPNIVQAIGGIIGGMLTFKAYKKIRV
ncbi:MAG: ECF transporter S component, partial [Bacilli bacterium]